MSKNVKRTVLQLAMSVRGYNFSTIRFSYEHVYRNLKLLFIILNNYAVKLFNREWFNTLLEAVKLYNQVLA
jgi:hypothetical protein